MESQSPSTSASSLFLQPANPSPSTSYSPSSTSSPSDPTSSPTSSPTTAPPTGDSSPERSVDEETSASDRDAGSSPRSTGDLPRGSLASRESLVGTVRAGVTAATTLAHDHLADDDGRQLGAYLLEDGEVETIGDAAAGLLSRRVPAGVGSPDVTDLVRLGLVVAGYVMRQLRIRREVRAMRAGAVAPVQPVDPYEEDFERA